MKAYNIRVSVLVTAYNEEKYLEDAIGSILNQNYKNYEIIIINDASTDDTEKIAKKFAKKFKNISLLNNKKNKFRGGALNSGLKIARGEYVCFLDGDDLITKNKLGDQVDFLDANPDIDLVYSRMNRFWSDGKKKEVPLLNNNYNLRDTMRKNKNRINATVIKPYRLILNTKKKELIPGAGVMLRRRIFDHVKYDERLKLAEDYDLWLQIIGAGFKLGKISKVHYLYRMHSSQITRKDYLKSKPYSLINKKLKSGVYFKTKYKKVLLQDNLFDTIGGAQKVTREIAFRLKKVGYDVSVICKKNENEKHFEIIGGIKIYRFPVKSQRKFVKLDEMAYQKKQWKCVLDKFFIDNSFDIILSRFPTFVSPTKNLAPNTPLIYLQPSLVSLALEKSSENREGLDRIQKKISSKIMKIIEKHAMKNCDIVIPRSNSMREIDMSEYGAKNLSKENVTSAVDKNQFCHKKIDKKIFKKYNLEDKKIILTVSRLSPDKNISFLVKIVPLLKDMNSVLMIVGSGKQMSILKKMAKKLNVEKRVLFVGESLHPEKYYNLADIFIMPSKQEGICNAIIESLSCGVPIMGFKSLLPKIVTPINDFVEKIECGFSFNNEKELISKINYLFENSYELKKFKQNALKRSKDFSWEKELKKILKIFTDFGVSLK